MTGFLVGRFDTADGASDNWGVLRHVPLSSLRIALGVTAAVSASAAVDFKREIRPILEVYCLKCHGDEKPKGDLSLTTRAAAIKGGDDGTSLVPGDPAKSSLYTLTTLSADHDEVMPPKGDKLSPAQQDLLKQWITEGAAWPEDLKLQQREKVDFVKQAKPILEVSCVSCHKEGNAKGDLRLDVREEAFKSGFLVAGDAMASKVYTTVVLPADHDDLMPPKKKGGPLAAAKADLLRDWIDQGAVWPDGMVLKEREPDASNDRDWKAVIAAIHARLIQNQQAAPATHQNYRETVHDQITFEMIAIPGGEFEMGSAEGAPGHQANESPRHRVKLDPFWMGRTEVTWNEYEVFQFPSLEKGSNISTERVNRELLLLTEFARPGDGGNPYVGKEADAVSRPTTPYVEMSFGMGKDGFPAISMTHYAALMYCRWLSAKTGH
ncbi:MAG: SUMF1/EgtB/PvdO family nonheme iron enzyme, partial [Verrucomicrobia bacterium]|nr:SUMF1/EgtB/PvdO family nonheme iron enzyme [Verrucomicrobiota bacterium]